MTCNHLDSDGEKRKMANQKMGTPHGVVVALMRQEGKEVSPSGC